MTAMDKDWKGAAHMKNLINFFLLAAIFASCEGVTFVSSGKDKTKGQGFTISGVAKDNVTGKPIVGGEVLLMGVGSGTQGSAIGGTSQIVLRAGSASRAGSGQDGRPGRRASGRPARARTGPAGEYVFPDVTLPEEGDVELVVRTPGFAPVYQTIARGGLSKGVRLAVNSRLLPVTASLPISAAGTALSSDGSLRLKLPPSALSGIRAASARRAKEAKKVVAQVAVADPKVDQDVSPGKMEAKEKKSDDEEKTVALEPVALVHVALTDEKGKKVDDVVTPEAPAKMVIEIPESIQEKHLEKFDKGTRHLDQFAFDESEGEWKKVGEARLLKSDPREDKSTEEKGKKDGNVTLCHGQKGSEDAYTLVLPSGAAEPHLKHGDKKGACEKRELFAEVAVTGSGWIVVAETHEESCVEGRVVDEDGNPAGEMWLRAEGLATGFLKEEKVDKNSGKYKIHVPKGQQVKLTAGLAAHAEKHKAKKEKKSKKKKNKKGKGQEEVLIDTESEVAKKTEAGCAPAGDVEAEDPVEIKVDLVDAEGSPVEGEVVTSEGTSATIESDGSVKVPAESGTVDLVVKSLEGETEVTTVVPVGGSDEEADHDLGKVVLPPVVALTGKVDSKSEEQPIEETLVIVEGNVVEPALDGTFEVLAPKNEETVTVEVVARTPDGTEFTEVTEVMVGDSDTASVPKVTVSTETVTLVGRVVDEEGDGVSGVEVEAGDAAIAVTDAEGRFEVEVPKESEILVVAHERDGDLDEDLTATQSVTPPAGDEPAVVELVINDPATVVEGRVKDADGDPVVGAEVVSSLGAFDTTDEDGKYELRAPENELVSVIAKVGETREIVEVQTEEAGTTETVDVPMPLEDIPPAVQSAEVEPLTVAPGGSVTLEVVVADDGSSVDFSVSEVEAGEVTTPAGNAAVKDGEATVTLTWKAPETEDLYEVPVTIQDASGQTTTVDVSVEVRKENAPPTIMQVKPSTQAPVAGEKVLVNAVADDPEDDKLQFDWTLKTEDGTDLSKLLEVDGGPLATFTCPNGLEDKKLELEVKVTDCLSSAASGSTAPGGRGRDDRIDPSGPVPGAPWMAAEGAGCKPVAERSETQDVTLDVGTGEARPPLTDVQAEPAVAVPETRLDSQPESLTRSADAQFKCASPDVNATFECALDGAAFRKCPAAQTYAELTSGAHTFMCRAKDASDTADPSPVVYSWTVDRVAPAFGGCSSAAASGAGQVELKWTPATDNVSAASDMLYQVCKANTSGGCCGSSFTPMFTTAAGASSYTVTGLTGSSQFYFVVRAQDKAGNVDTNQTERSVAFAGSAPSRIERLSPSASSCGGN